MMRWPSLSFLQGRGLWALYFAYAGLLFAVFLLVTFPYDVILRRALAGLDGGGVSVGFQDARFAWHRGIALDRFTLHSADTAIAAPVLEADHVWVRPSLAALLRGNPYALELRAELYGGTARADADFSNEQMVGRVDLDALSLGRYRLLASMLEEGRLGGRVDAEFAFETTLAAPDAGQVLGSVRLTRAAIEAAKIAGFGVPDIHVEAGEVEFAYRNGRLDLSELRAEGKEILLSADGQISLRAPVADSILNLSAIVGPGPEAPDAIRGLLELIPRPAGAGSDAPLRITGTIARPRVR